MRILADNDTPALHALTGQTYVLHGQHNEGQSARVVQPCFLLDNRVLVQNTTTGERWSAPADRVRAAIERG